MSEELVSRLRTAADGAAQCGFPGESARYSVAADLIERQSAALAAKDAEIARLRTMISRYGAHDDNCESWIKQGGTFRLCDCGFSRALTPPGAEP